MSDMSLGQLGNSGVITPDQVAAMTASTSPSATPAPPQDNGGGLLRSWANLMGLKDTPTSELTGPSSGNTWSDIANNIGAAGYSALNQLGLGLPDFLVKKIGGSENYKKLHDFLSQYPLASAGGNVSGLVGSMGTGEAEAKALSKLPVIGKTFRWANTPGGGLLGGALKGAIAAAPQAGIRALTGNITPEQAKTGMLFGAALGGMGGVLGGKAPMLGQASNKIEDLKKFLVNETLGDLGIGKNMMRSTASYGFKSNQLLSKADAAENLANKTFQIYKGLASKKGGIDRNFRDWIAENSEKPLNALNKAWVEGGIDPMQQTEAFVNLPSVQKMLKSHLPGVSNEALQMINTEPAIMQDIAKHAIEAGQSPIAAIHQYADKAFDAPYLTAQGANVGLMKMRQEAGQAMVHKLDEVAKQAAIDQGLTTAKAVDKAWQDYPARVLIAKKLQNDAMGTGGINVGSDTAVKMMLGHLANPLAGGVLGYEVAPEQNKTQGALLGALGSLALGGSLGNYANRMITRGMRNVAAKGNVKAYDILDQLAKGKTASHPAAAELASGLAPVAPAATAIGGGKGPEGPSTIPAIPGIGGTPEGQSTNGYGSPINIPAVNPETASFQELASSDSPYLRAIAGDLQNIWAKEFSLQGVPLDAVVKEAAKETDGFKDLRKVAGTILFRKDPAAAERFLKNYNIGNTLKSTNFKSVVDAMKPFTEGGKYAGFGLSPSGNAIGNQILRMNPKARDVLTQINQLAHIAGVDPRVAQADLMRIASVPNWSDEEKEAQMEKYYIQLYSAVNNLGFNPMQLQQLGLFPEQ